MRWIEVCLNTPSEEIDARCEALAALGAEGFVIENEEDFRAFLENNRQYWDYVDKDLEEQYAGVSHQVRMPSAFSPETGSPATEAIPERDK